MEGVSERSIRSPCSDEAGEEEVEAEIEVEDDLEDGFVSTQR